ncbi:MAG: YciI family protein [Rhodospirillales bacterium]|nr:YciI family protein [Rhodospirillales bacterium]
MVGSKDNSLTDGHAALGLVHYAVMSEFTGKEGDRTAVRDEHLAYQGQLEAEGRLFCAGPLLKESGDMAGIGLIIYKAASLDEAREIADNDPFHKSGLRAYKIWPWKINEGGIDLKLRFAAGVFEIE